MEHSVVGFARLCEGLLEEAEPVFQTALRINPNHVDTMVNMANLRVLQGQPHVTQGVAGRRLQPCQ